MLVTSEGHSSNFRKLKNLAALRRTTAITGAGTSPVFAMGRFPFARAWLRGFDAGSLGVLRKRLSDNTRRRFHQLTNERSVVDGKSASNRSGVRNGSLGSDGASSRTGGATGSKHGKSSSTSTQTLQKPKGAVKRGLAAYNRMNTSHPTSTKVGTSVVILLFGDASAQRIQHEAKRRSTGQGGVGSKQQGNDSKRAEDPTDRFVLDKRRLLAFASFGALYTGWFQMHWFGILQSWFPSPSAAALATSGRKFSFLRKDVIGPLLVNQFLMVPAGYYPFYFAWTGFVRGDDFVEIKTKTREKYKLHLLAQNWAFWLPAQGVQFALVPSSYHILYVSAMGLAWNTILSLTTLDNNARGSTGSESQENKKKIVVVRRQVVRAP